MIIQCTYFDKQYTKKPDTNEVKFIIQKSLKPTQMDIKDLAKGLIHGCTFRPAVLNGTHKSDWQKQELFALDFDHDLTIDEGLQRCKDLKLFPAFGYVSFSHSANEHRYRLVFHCSKIITDVNERNKIQLALMAAFPKCDPSCKNGDRLFFGGKAMIYENYDAVFDPDELIEKFYKPYEDKPQKEKKAKSDKSVNNNSEKPIVKKSTKTLAAFDNTHDEKIKAIQHLDVPAMRKLLGISDINNNTSKHPQIEINLTFSQKDIELIEKIMPKVQNQYGIGLNESVFYNKFNSNILLGILNLIFEYAPTIRPFISITDNRINDNSNNEISDLESKSKKSGLITKTLINSPLFLKNEEKNPPNILFDSKSELYNYIDSLDLFEYLGVGEGYFNCFLPNHSDDTKPSAHIYTKDDGRQVYRCFGCDRTRSLISITEELAGCKRHEAINFVKAVYGIDYNNSDWIQQQQQILIDSANFLDTEEFKENFPELYKRISRQKGHLKEIILHFIPLINEELQKDGKPLFFASYNTLQGVCNILSRDTITRMITQFVTLNLMEKPEDKDIPPKALNKARSIATSHGYGKHCNFYVVDDYGVNTLAASEETAKLLKEKNVRAKSFSREMFLRTFSVAENESTYADRIYPQLKGFEKKTTQQSDDFTMEIASCILDKIEEKSFTTENEIINTLTDYDHKASSTDRQLKRSLQEIIDSYGLQRIRANKAIKEQYGVKSNGYPFIIIRKSETEENTDN